MVTTLTLDLGTSATKAALWRGGALHAMTRASIDTSYPEPGFAEQEPDDWWGSTLHACSELREQAPDEYGEIEAIGFSSARETFALFDASLRPLTRGILWSDRRGEATAAAFGDPGAFRASTGVVLNAGTHAAKLAWVADAKPDELARSRWVLQPRDLVLARLTGRVVTDETLASRTGLCGLTGGWLDGARETYGERLPPIVGAATLVGGLTTEAARVLRLGPDVQVVAGAGDRACEVLGTGSSALAPMVSFGTTANASVPHAGPPDALPIVAAVSRGALGGYLVEAGLSAAGAAIAWLASLTGRDHDALFEAAADVEPGAAGMVALPWLAGARGPWWQPDTRAAFVGLTDAHGAGELARAILEGVALDAARCIDLVAPDAAELIVAGGGAAQPVWRSVLAAVTDRPVARRATDDAASVGARLVVAAARDEVLTVDDVSPVVGREEPDAALVAAYRDVRAASDAAAAAVLGIENA
ncbi:MAG TPA: FGGY family carbohydrate kinase [Acidimicrobiia bacterium]|jgi:xylulokinase